MFVGVVIEKYHWTGTRFHLELNMYCQVQTSSHSTFPHQYCHQRRSTSASFMLNGCAQTDTSTYLFHFEESSTCEVTVTASLMLRPNSLQL